MSKIGIRDTAKLFLMMYSPSDPNSVTRLEGLIRLYAVEGYIMGLRKAASLLDQPDIKGEIEKLIKVADE